MITARELRSAFDTLFRSSMLGEAINQGDILFRSNDDSCKWYRRCGDEWVLLDSVPQEVLDACEDFFENDE